MNKPDPNTLICILEVPGGKDLMQPVDICFSICKIKIVR